MVCPVFTEPRDVDAAELARLLEQHWGLRKAVLEYAPVGFGGYHWRCVEGDGTRYFVTADDLRAAHHGRVAPDAVEATLERAFRTAVALREGAGLEFVVAPIRDDEGSVLRRLGDHHVVRIEPFVDGVSADDGEYGSAAERRRVATAIGRLHAASDRVPAGLLRRDDLAIPSRAGLDLVLDDLNEPWGAGPYSEPARSLIRSSAADLRRRLRAFDEAADRARAAPEPWVVTHGEPHRANVVMGDGGSVHLVDWDTVRVAPRERDLRTVLDDDRTGWDEYTAEAGDVALRPEVLDLYAEGWNLAEIAIYVTQFRAPHHQTQDTLVAWEALNEYLPRRGATRAIARSGSNLRHEGQEPPDPEGDLSLRP